MDFTEVHQQTSNLVAFSPGAQFVLTAIENRLYVRRVDTFQIARTWLVDTSPSATSAILSVSTRKAPPSAATSQEGWISHISWSRDSEYILAACVKRGVVNLFKLRDQDWDGRIECGAEGLTRAEWAPDGRSILCFSEWGLRVTIWSLTTGLATYIQYPKHLDKGYAFRKDARYFLLAERHKSRDALGVYDVTKEFKLVRHFPLPTTSLSSISLSPTGNHVAVWEGSLEYKLYILNLVGQVLATFAPPEADPALGLGIRTVSWHPSGIFIAVGGWDDKIHVLSSHRWIVVLTFEISSRIPPGVVVWREPGAWPETTEGPAFVQYDRLTPPNCPSIPLIRPDQMKPHPKNGLIQLDWNLDGTLLLARFEQSPTNAFIYSFPSPSDHGASSSPRLKSVLMHNRPISNARWNPTKAGAMALCCAGGGAIYNWEDHGFEEIADCVGVPMKDFDVRDLRWAPDGKGLVLLDKEAFCAVFMVDDGVEGTAEYDDDRQR